MRRDLLIVHKSTKEHLLVVFSLILISSVLPNVFAWSNGGYSENTSSPDYGSHDWIAQHALDWLPSNEKEYIEDNLAAYLYGTELPDNGVASDGIGDTTKHHIYYFPNGTLQDDSSAVRASEEYDLALSYLKANDFVNAAKHVGIMSHYIADVAVFGHVMGSGTDWGAEQHHSDYEAYVNTRTNSYEDDFNFYLSYDGSLDIITAYDAALNLAYDTTFDFDGDLTCLWMDSNYDWNNPLFKNRCGELLNSAVNYLADVIHTLYYGGGIDKIGDLTVWKNAVLVVGTSEPYGPLPWGALIDDAIGANDLVTALSYYGTASSAFDVEVAEWIESSFDWKTGSPTSIVAIGGTAVNLVSYEYNRLVHFDLNVTSECIELKVDWYGIDYIRLYYDPKKYVIQYSNGTEADYSFEDNDFAEVYAYFDPIKNKHIFLVMGMCAEGTLGACRYLVNNLNSFSSEIANAEGIVLRWYDTNSDGVANGEEMKVIATYP